MQKGHVKHVEEPPVVGDCPCVGITCKKSGDYVPLFPGVGVPDFIPADPQTDNQGAGLHCLLESPVRIRVPGGFLQVLIGTYIELVPSCAYPQYMTFVIVSHGQAADLQVRNIGYQRCSDKKGAGEALKDFGGALGCLFLRGRPMVGICNPGFFSGNYHRTVKTVHMLENSFQQISSCLQPAFPGEARVRAELEIQCPGFKFHVDNPPAHYFLSSYAKPAGAVP